MKPGAGRTARFADQVRFVHQVAHGPASGLDPPPDGTSARLNQAVEFAYTRSRRAEPRGTAYAPPLGPVAGPSALELRVMPQAS
jgi:hypothetical protein